MRLRKIIVASRVRYGIPIGQLEFRVIDVGDILEVAFQNPLILSWLLGVCPCRVLALCTA